jgi:hypothetical protein
MFNSYIRIGSFKHSLSKFGMILQIDEESFWETTSQIPTK